MKRCQSVKFVRTMRLMKRVKCLSSFFESLVKEIDGVQHLLMMKRLEIANRSH